MKAGDYLHFKVADDWQLYYKILKINEKSITASFPSDSAPPDAVIHKVLEVHGFESDAPIMTIYYDKHLVYLRKINEE